MRGIGRELEQHVAVLPLDVRQRRDDGNPFLFGKAEHRLQSRFIDGSHDEIRLAECLVGDDLTDTLRAAPRIVKPDVHRIAEPLHAVESQQEALVKFEVIGIRRTADLQRQKQRDVERFAAAQRPEFDGGGRIGPERRKAVAARQGVGGQRCRPVRSSGDLDHGAGLQVGGCHPAVERTEFRFGDAEPARERIERLARVHDVVGRALVRHTVERTPVLLPLFDAPRLVLRADLLSADQDAFARPQVRGVDARIVPDDGLHGNLVLPRNGVERLALRDEVEIERLAEFALRLAVLLRGDLRHDGNADVHGALQPLGQRRIVLHDDLLAHAVEFRQPVERLARLHGVDVILRPVDIDDRPGLFAGRQGAEAPCGEQQCGAKSFHPCLSLSRIRISVITFLV